MCQELIKLYSRDGLSTKSFIFALSLPYCAHFSEAFSSGDTDGVGKR